MNTISEEFFLRMQNLLSEEDYQAYLGSLDEKPRRGMRINLLKTDAAEFFRLMPMKEEKTKFCDHGYYLHGEAALGATPAACSGLFYMQEPSASSAVTILHPGRGDRVLDLCAAPGSKSTQIAEDLMGTGFLCVNEINAKRARVLLENMEKCGTPNALVCNNDPRDIARAFPSFFDCVLCDAPCSGEGMFRKSEDARKQWTPQLSDDCAALQKKIIEEAYLALAPGGTLVYSTCTFSEGENEAVIRHFLAAHPDMHIDTPEVPFGRLSRISDEGSAVRIFPMDGGEGHFICRMKKDGSGRSDVPVMKSTRLPKEAETFLKENLSEGYPYYFCRNNFVYGGTAPFYKADGCHVLRHQVLLGEVRNGRFIPDHHFYLSAYGTLFNKIELNDTDALQYLHGQQLNIAAPKGWHPVCWHGHAMGGVHSDGKSLKNKYPKALRLR